MSAANNAQCGRCAFCVAGCPVFSATMRQALGPRSKNYLLDRIQDGDACMSPDLAQAFYLCTHCGQCAAVCPSKTPVLERIMEGRCLAAGQGFTPDKLAQAIKAINREGNPFAEPKAKRTDLYPEIPPPLEKGGTLFWAGCMAAYQDLKVIPAVLKAFQAAGETIVSLGERESCCGYLAWLAGDRDAFQEIARKNASLLAAADRIVTSCAGCRMTFENIYPEYGQKLPPTLHFASWLDETIAALSLAPQNRQKPLRVIYHDPCDLGRHGGLYEPPRQVIQALPGVRLLEFDANRQEAVCCGGGGGIKAVDPSLSLKMAETRVLSALKQESDVIASACPSCKQNLNQAVVRLKKKGLLTRRIKVMDLSELVAAHLG